MSDFKNVNLESFLLQVLLLTKKFPCQESVKTSAETELTELHFLCNGCVRITGWGLGLVIHLPRGFCVKPASPPPWNKQKSTPALQNPLKVRNSCISTFHSKHVTIFIHSTILSHFCRASLRVRPRFGAGARNRKASACERTHRAKS